jgi:hypothetical protein
MVCPQGVEGNEDDVAVLDFISSCETMLDDHRHEEEDKGGAS